ncbi:unnamed protein product [Amoebophrya sp. A25]|nr:unnamed protein product [Amoebophrya sp. A25]|eukprot:GSA25T00011428001.1
MPKGLEGAGRTAQGVQPLAFCRLRRPSASGACRAQAGSWKGAEAVPWAPFGAFHLPRRSVGCRQAAGRERRRPPWAPFQAFHPRQTAPARVRGYRCPALR